ncbi:MAG TPA: hypothetical protein VK524_13005 [Polyangiaceae bacterium]|nr:hypothetical protein [Polyangiaceae bacterium]
MHPRHSRRATLVVIEFGANWPRWLSPDSQGDMAVVAQHYEGPPGSLVTQVASRIARLESMSWSFDSIVLVANGRTDPQASATRSVLARGLLARLASGYSGRLVLSLDDCNERSAVHALMGLAAALDDSAHPGIELCVRIGSDDAAAPSASSGVVLARAS